MVGGAGKSDGVDDSGVSGDGGGEGSSGSNGFGGDGDSVMVMVVG